MFEGRAAKHPSPRENRNPEGNTPLLGMDDVQRCVERYTKSISKFFLNRSGKHFVVLTSSHELAKSMLAGPGLKLLNRR